MIEGLSHITLIVEDLDKSAALFINLFNARIVYKSDDNFHSVSKELFLAINDLWIALMLGDTVQSKSYNHIAFKISNDDYRYYLDKIIELGLDRVEDRNRLPGEGKSLYFYDYDNHLFELHTGSLNHRLAEYKKL